jgi:hypothetical protein
MSWFRVTALLLVATPAWGFEGYVIGAGVEADTEDSMAATLSADLGIAKETWLSAAIATSRVDLPRGTSIDTLYADIGIDHWFQPVGIRLGVAYWGDSDVLSSNDYRGSLYWRNDRVSIAGNYEFRDFTFDIFRNDFLPGQDIEFHANGVGLSARFELSPTVDLGLSGMDYDYNVNLGVAENRPIVDFLSVSRLSLLNSLIDYRARVELGVDVGNRRWSLDYATWKGEVDGRRTESLTLRFLTPMGKASDIEFGLGVDHSDDFGSVTLFSVFLFFYG